LLRDEAVEGAVFLVVVEVVEFAVVFLAEGYDPVARPRDFAVRDDLVAPEARGPDLAGHPVAADVGALQIVETLAAVAVAAGNGGRLAVREVERRRQDRGRAALALETGGLPALHDGPAVVAAALNAVDHLPRLPADVADPQVAGRAVESHFPGV